MMNLLKKALTFSVFMLFFTSYTLSASAVPLAESTDFYGEETALNLSGVPAPSTSTAKKEACYHWGLSHWLNGIAEYTCVSACCYCYTGEDMKIVNSKDSVYKIRHYKTFGSYKPADIEREIALDCCFLAYTKPGNYDRHGEGCLSCCCMPVCMPIALITHLCSLPCACYNVSKPSHPIIIDFHPMPKPTYISAPSPATMSSSPYTGMGKEELRRRQEEESAAHRRREEERAETARREDLRRKAELDRLRKQTESERQYYERERARQAAEANRRRV